MAIQEWERSTIKAILGAFTPEHPLIISQRMAEELKQNGIEGNYQVSKPIPESKSKRASIWA